jgi:hypothetical protein
VFRLSQAQAHEVIAQAQGAARVEPKLKAAPAARAVKAAPVAAAPRKAASDTPANATSAAGGDWKEF